MLNKDGTLALLGLNDGSAALYTVTGERLLLLTEPGAEEQTEHFSQIRGLAISPDESKVAVGFAHRRVAIWSITGELISTLQHPLGSSWLTDGCRQCLASSLAFSPDGEHLFAGFGDYTAALWEVATGRLLVNASTHKRSAIAARVLGDTILWATADGQVWSGSDGMVRRSLRTNECWYQAAFDEKSESVLVQTDQGEIKRWNFEGRSNRLGHFKTELSLRDEPVSVWCSSDNKLSIYPKNAECLVFHGSSGVREFSGPLPLERILVSKNERTVVVHRSSQWRPRTPHKELTEAIDLTSGSRVEVAGTGVLSPDGKWLARQSRGPKDIVELWSTTNGELVRRLHLDHSAAMLVFTADSRNLVTTSRGGYVRLIRLGPAPRFRRLSRSLRHKTRRRFHDLDFDSLAALSGNRLMIFRRSGIEVWQGLNEQVARLEVPQIDRWGRRPWWLSANEETLAVETGANRFELFSVEDGRRVASYGAPVPRPLDPPVGRVFWRLEGHVYHHQGDYLRGGFRTMPISADERYLLTEDSTGHSLIDLSDPPFVAQRLPSEGSLRAGWIGDHDILILEATGRLFRFARPPEESPTKQ